VASLGESRTRSLLHSCSQHDPQPESPRPGIRVARTRNPGDSAEANFRRSKLPRTSPWLPTTPPELAILGLLQCSCSATIALCCCARAWPRLAPSAATATIRVSHVSSLQAWPIRIKQSTSPVSSDSPPYPKSRPLSFRVKQPQSETFDQLQVGPATYCGNLVPARIPMAADPVALQISLPARGIQVPRSPVTLAEVPMLCPGRRSRAQNHAYQPPAAPLSCAI